MKLRVLGIALAAAFAMQLPAQAGQVPNPVNAPASIAHAGGALIASGTNPQQSADSGLSLTSEGQNLILAGPASGGAGAPNFRNLTSADMPTSGAGAGSVTSVGLTLPGQFSCSGSPVTASGTLACSWNTQSANAVFAGPSSGSAASPGFRALAAADVPAINLSATGAGGVTGALPNSGLANASITIAGAPVALGGTASLSPLTVTLSSPVALNNTATAFDILHVSQGTTGVFIVMASVTALGGAATDQVSCRIWDGTTTFVASRSTIGAAKAASIMLSAIITNPAGDLHLNCQDTVSVSGSVEASGSGFGTNDTVLSVFRIG